MIGAGGINLGASQETVIDKIGAPSFIRPGRLRKADKRKVEFWQYAGLILPLWDGEVREVITNKGYLGSTPHGLRIRDSWEQLRRIYRTITFSEDLCVWYIPGINGLSIEIVRPPRAEELATWTPERLENPWVGEVYEVLDPDHAVISGIYVHDLRYSQWC